MKQLLLNLSLIITLGLGVVLFTPDVSANVLSEACQSNPQSALCTNSQSGGFEDIVRTIINVLLTIVGIVAVIMIIVSGFRFATSGGSAEGVKAGKNGLLYSIIGLVVAILAFAIVNIVLDTF